MTEKETGMPTALSNNIKPDISKLVETEGDFQLTIKDLENILSVRCYGAVYTQLIADVKKLVAIVGINKKYDRE